MTTLNELMLLLQAGFVQRAFIVGLIVAVLSSILSVFIVLKRVSLIGDGLSHTAFGGLALGYYLDIVPLWVAAVVVVLGSLGITRAIRSTRISSDAAVAVFLQLGLSSGIVLISLARGFGISIESLLFGSILLVNVDQIIIASVILVAVLGVIFLFYKELVYTTFSETQARASGVQTWFFDYLVATLAGVVVIAAIPIVGVLLISALLVLPALTSIQIGKSFKQTIIMSPIFGIASAFLGLFVSLIFDIASGATIVLMAMAIFVAVLGAKRISAR